MKEPFGTWRTVCGKLAEIIITTPASRATAYLSKDLIVSAQQRLYKKKKRFNARTVEILYKIGKPNYKERMFIKQCERAGEPFPVKKIQIKESR